ncbi:uncharacterized protein J3R85_012786 [Psidium guajava]|nr:uncharacterized protein J3R85_012786 [Psidium guajava]
MSRQHEKGKKKAKNEESLLALNTIQLQSRAGPPSLRAEFTTSSNAAAPPASRRIFQSSSL